MSAQGFGLYREKKKTEHAETWNLGTVSSQDLSTSKLCFSAISQFHNLVFRRTSLCAHSSQGTFEHSFRLLFWNLWDDILWIYSKICFIEYYFSLI